MVSSARQSSCSCSIRKSRCRTEALRPSDSEHDLVKHCGLVVDVRGPTPTEKAPRPDTPDRRRPLVRHENVIKGDKVERHYYCGVCNYSWRVTYDGEKEGAAVHARTLS